MKNSQNLAGLIEENRKILAPALSFKGYNKGKLFHKSEVEKIS